MRNKITILFDTYNSKESREVYDLIDELLKTHIIDKGIIKKIFTTLNINCN